MPSKKTRSGALPPPGPSLSGLSDEDVNSADEANTEVPAKLSKEMKAAVTREVDKQRQNHKEKNASNLVSRCLVLIVPTNGSVMDGRTFHYMQGLGYLEHMDNKGVYISGVHKGSSGSSGVNPVWLDDVTHADNVLIRAFYFQRFLDQGGHKLYKSLFKEVMENPYFLSCEFSEDDPQAHPTNYRELKVTAHFGQDADAATYERGSRTLQDLVLVQAHLALYERYELKDQPSLNKVSCILFCTERVDEKSFTLPAVIPGLSSCVFAYHEWKSAALSILGTCGMLSHIRDKASAAYYPRADERLLHVLQSATRVSTFYDGGTWAYEGNAPPQTAFAFWEMIELHFESEHNMEIALQMSKKVVEETKLDSIDGFPRFANEYLLAKKAHDRLQTSVSLKYPNIVLQDSAVSSQFFKSVMDKLPEVKLMYSQLDVATKKDQSKVCIQIKNELALIAIREDTFSVANYSHTGLASGTKPNAVEGRLTKKFKKGGQYSGSQVLTILQGEFQSRRRQEGSSWNPIKNSAKGYASDEDSVAKSQRRGHGGNRGGGNGRGHSSGNNAKRGGGNSSNKHGKTGGKSDKPEKSVKFQKDKQRKKK